MSDRVPVVEQSTPPPRPRREPASENNLVYLSARVPKDLRDELQHQAIREGRPVAQLMQDAVRAYLHQHTNT